MMIAMMVILLLCIRFSVLMTTNAAFFHSHHMKGSHEYLDYEPVSSTMFSRKLLLKEMVKDYGDQDLVLYNDEKAALLLGGTQNRGNEVVIFGEKGSDPTHFSNMDYSSVRRRRPIHNNSSSSKTTDSP